MTLLKSALLVLAGLFALLALGVTVALIMPLARFQPVPAPGATLIRNVAIPDLETGAMLRGQSVLLDGDRITAVGPGLSAPAARVIEGDNLFAIPGLFDMHVHSFKLAPALTHPLFIAHGVTAVRDMGGCLGEDDAWAACAADKRSWHRAVTTGEMVGPRYDQITSLAINGGSEIPSGQDARLGAATPDGARLRAAHDARRGIDFLKPYSALSRPAYLALAVAADEHGLYLAGHLPLAVPATEAVTAGQRSIEHAMLFIWDCYADMGALRSSADIRAAYTDDMRRKMIAQHDEGLCNALHGQMVTAGTGFVPTHTTRKMDAFATDPDYLGDSRLRYIPAPLRYMWQQDAAGMAERDGGQGQASYRAFYQFGIEQTGIAHRAGVIVMTGTDAPDSFVFPGSSLHDELDHLVAAGLSPLDALRAATVVPAEFLGLAGHAGVVAEGARADLLLVGANPLEDIRALRDIRTVVLAGRAYDRTALDQMLDTVEDNANRWSLWVKFLWQVLRSPIMRAQFAD